jgi:uncharacterized protein YjdB
MMNHIIVAILVLSLSFQGLSSNIATAAPNIPVTSVSISPRVHTVGLNLTHQLTATVLPLNATNRNVFWSSSNTSTASVDSNGIVTAFSTGTVQIEVRTIDGGFTDVSTITVVIPVTGVMIRPSVTTTTVGGTLTLIEDVLPSNANNQDVDWSSDNTSVATVDSTGLVTGRSAGTATIKATTREGRFEDTRTITVLNVPVTGISVTPISTNVSVNRTVQLNATVFPSNATNKAINWSSSDRNIAYVDSSGLVIGVRAGTATITATAVDNSVVTSTSTSTVNVISVPVTGVSVAPSFATMMTGDTIRLNAAIVPFNASDTRIRWDSSDSTIASVDSTGLVTAGAVGTAIITATTLDGNFRFSSTITVGRRAAGVTLDPTTLRFRSTTPPQQLTHRVIPADAYDLRVTWTSSDSTVAFVNTSGLVTRTGAAGTATITVRTVDGGHTATTRVVIISVPVTSITLAPATPPAIVVGATQQLTANVLPANATDRSVRWQSSNPSVATVSTTGLVTGVSGGTAEITATTEDGGLWATVRVTVNVIPVTGITVAPTTATVNIGATQQLTANVAPANATNRNVIWSSSDTSIATVNSAGLVTGVRNGIATITAMTVDGNRTASSVITVAHIPVTGITLSPANAALNAGTALQLMAVIAPANASNRNLIWNSSDTNIAVVDFNGLVTGLSAGTATITVMTVDGARTATSTITTFAIPVTGVNLSHSTATINAGSSLQLSATVQPATASNRNVTWSSSNISVGTVDHTGLVTAIRAGNATITARTVDGGRTAASQITVIGQGPPAQGQQNAVTQSLTRGRTTLLTIGGVLETTIPANAVTGQLSAVTAWIVPNDDARPIVARALAKGLASLSSPVMLSLSGGNIVSPVGITLNFDPAIITVGRTPAIFAYNDRTDRWIYIGGQRTGDTVTASVGRFAMFGVFAADPLPVMNDIANHWARNPIVTLAGMDILGGYPDGSFRPDTNVTRAEFAAMLTRTLGIGSNPQAAGRFADAAGFDWAKGAIGAAVNAGLMGGFPDGTFGSVRGISRAEIAAILERVISRGHVRVDTMPNAVSFADNIPAWARNGVQIAARAGLMSGFLDNTFRPERIASRAEVAAILYRLIAED